MTHPQLAPEAQRILELSANRPLVTTLTPEEAREQSRARRLLVNRPAEPVASVGDLTVDGPGGPLTIRRYDPLTDTLPAPAIVFFHGGGWVVGDVDGHDPLCRQLANRVGATVFSVAYRLAPESPYPAALDDAVTALRCVFDQAVPWGIDPSRVAVAGDSSGGNLAAAAAIRWRDEGGPGLAAQLLIYPVTLCALEPEGYDATLETAFLTAPGMAWYTRHYLANAEDAAQSYASPLLVRDAGQLPPTVIVSAEVDVLRPQIWAYRDRLAAANVPLVSLYYPGLFHGFIAMSAELEGARRALEESTQALAAFLAEGAPST
jgi:acetyl esterase